MSALARRLAPGRHELVDAAFLAALVGLGLSGFKSAFGGVGFLSAGLLAVVVGLAVAYVIVRLDLPGPVGLVLALVAFLLVGAPIAVRDRALAGVLPTPAAVAGLIDGCVSGWRRLLTTLPPSGSLGNLLAVPYLCGFVAALVGFLLARRTRWLAALLVTPTAVLGVSVLFGTRRPYSLVWQGGVFAAVALAWLGARRSRERRVYLQASGRRRAVGAVVMLAVIGAAGFWVGPRLPLADATTRRVLRDATEPPFDPRQFGSPLNGFQRYLSGDLKDSVMFAVTGLPADAAVTRVRLAVMDDYDGVVWRVSPASGTQGGRFVRVGESVPTTVDGTDVKLAVTVRDLPGVWLPDIGTVTGVRWTGTGERRTNLRDTFRLSTVTSTGAVPVAGGWKAGDTYTVSGVIPTPPAESVYAASRPDRSIRTDLTVKAPEELQTLAATVTKGKATPYEQAKALEAYLLTGYYTTGDQSAGQVQNSPGHSYARLLKFVEDDLPIGNAEQYAATMAVMARSLGLPSRVVMGFRVKQGQTEVLGRDVDAWVEIGFADGGWRLFDPTPRDNQRKPEGVTKKPQPVFESQEVPPPPVLPPEADVNTRQGKTNKPVEKPKDEKKPVAPPSHLATVLALAGASAAVVVLAPIGLVLALKRRRRRRRRRATDPTARVAGGWYEYVDTARDIGLPVPPKSTRRELALMIAAPDALTLAADADAVVFGPGQPTPDDVSDYWDRVDDGRRRLRSTLPWWRRLRASLSLTSLRGST